MTPAAKQIIESTVQAIKRRWTSPQFAMLMRAETINAEVGMPRIVYMRDLMLLGSVLLPEPEPDPDTPDVAPVFYLDSPLRRALITRELRISIREFVRRADVGSWAGLIVADGAPRGSTAIPRRFHATNFDSDQLITGWTPRIVYTQPEKDAEGSTVPADATTLPDFEAVTDQMRYAALGL